MSPHKCTASAIPWDTSRVKEVCRRTRSRGSPLEITRKCIATYASYSMAARSEYFAGSSCSNVGCGSARVLNYRCEASHDDPTRSCSSGSKGHRTCNSGEYLSGLSESKEQEKNAFPACDTVGNWSHELCCLRRRSEEGGDACGDRHRWRCLRRWRRRCLRR